MATRALQGLLGDEVKTSAVGSAGNRRGPVKGFLASVQRAAGALEFERARVEIKAVETLVHLRLAVLGRAQTRG